MKIFAIRMVFVLGFSVLHLFLLYALFILSFVGSFGAPQGTDAGFIYETTGPVAIFRNIIDGVIAVLWFPGSLFEKSGLQPIYIWIANSLVWGTSLTLVFSRLKKPQTAEQGAAANP